MSCLGHLFLWTRLELDKISHLTEWDEGAVDIFPAWWSKCVPARCVQTESKAKRHLVWLLDCWCLFAPSSQCTNCMAMSWNLHSSISSDSVCVAVYPTCEHTRAHQKFQFFLLFPSFFLSLMEQALAVRRQRLPKWNIFNSCGRPRWSLFSPLTLSAIALFLDPTSRSFWTHKSDLCQELQVNWLSWGWLILRGELKFYR